MFVFLVQVSTIPSYVALESLNVKKSFFLVISLGRVVVPSPKTVINLPGTYPVKENPIYLAVSEILWYKHTHKHTDKQTSCYFIIGIGYPLSICINFAFSELAGGAETSLVILFSFS